MSYSAFRDDWQSTRSTRSRAWPALVMALSVIFAAGSIAVGAPIKVMSFNIRADFDFGTPTNSSEAWIALSGNHRRNLVTTLVNQQSPDILGVQEAFRNQVVDLQSAMPGYSFYGIGRNDGVNFGEHSAIYYRSDRFARVNQGTFWLSNSPGTVGSVFPGAATIRIASWAILTDHANADQQYFVLDTHWDHVSQDARLHSANLIRQQIGALAGGRPLIVMGDMNAIETNPAITNLLGANDPGGLQLMDSYREAIPVRSPNEATFHGYSGSPAGSRIDYILHSDFFRATEAAIVRTNFNGRYPSDHFPVTAVLEPIPEPASWQLAIALMIGFAGRQFTTLTRLRWVQVDVS